MKKMLMLTALLAFVPACASKEEAAPAADSVAIDTVVVTADSTSVITIDSSAIYQK